MRHDRADLRHCQARRLLRQPGSRYRRAADCDMVLNRYWHFSTAGGWQLSVLTTGGTSLEASNRAGIHEAGALRA